MHPGVEVCGGVVIDHGEAGGRLSVDSGVGAGEPEGWSGGCFDLVAHRFFLREEQVVVSEVGLQGEVEGRVGLAGGVEAEEFGGDGCF